MDRPARLRRFGPQPRVVRAPRPRTGDGMPALRSFEMAELRHQVEAKERQDDTVIVTASRLAADSIAPDPPPPQLSRSDFEAEPLQVTDEALMRDLGLLGPSDFVTKPATLAERVVPSGGPTTNALAMTLMSGPQVIRVSARLSFDYATPLDGMILTDEDAPT